MARKKISRNPKKSSLNTQKKEYELRPEMMHLLEECDPEKEICDGKLFKSAFWECMENNDPEGAIEMIEIYMNAINKKKQREKHKLPKSTMYNAIKSRNPTIKTLAKMISCCM